MNVIPFKTRRHGAMALTLLVVLALSSFAARRALGAPTSASRDASLTHYRNSSAEKVRVCRAIVARMTHDGVESIAAKSVVTGIDIDSGWAWVGIRTRDNSTDPARFLLRKQSGGAWRALVYGTSFEGTGDTYHVPARLCRKWGIEPPHGHGRRARG